MSDTSCNVQDYSRNRAINIFWKVFLFSACIQLVRTSIFLTDHSMWASQIRFFLTKNPRQFDFFAAYGHPGTTLVSLGSLFHLLFGVSYENSLTLALSLLIASLTAAGSLLCYLLQPQTLWWFTTGFILTFSRFYVKATPPTATVTAFIVVIVLSSCWLWKQQRPVSIRTCFAWGFILGLSTSTRFDITALVGVTLLLLLIYKNGIRIVMPVLFGGLIAFYSSDPYLWFMPVKHLKDLFHMLIIHSSHKTGQYGILVISGFEWVHGTFLAVIAIIWFLYLLIKKRLAGIVPSQVLLLFLGCSLLTTGLLVASKVQAMRYLYPLLVVWEIFLPLFVLQHCPKINCEHLFASGRLDSKTAFAIMGLIIPAQLIGYLFMFSV